MKSNFLFIQNHWKDIYQEAVETEKNTFTAPRTSIFYARRTLELIVKWLYENDRDIKTPYETHLSALMYEPSFRDQLPKNLFQYLNYIRKIGNLAVHSRKRVTTEESLRAVKNLYLFAEWLAVRYSPEETQIPEFDENIIPREGGDELRQAELQRLQREMEQRDKEIEEHKKQLEDYKKLLEEKQNQVEKTKEQNRGRSTSRTYTEAETRKLFIDLLLKEAGWDPAAENATEFEVQGMPNNHGVGYVDYVLWGDDGLPLGIIEAKKTAIDPDEGQHQAELYADCLEKKYGQRPVIFYSNGYDHWIWEDDMYPPRPVQGFYTKDQLRTLINRRNARKELSQIDINKNITERHYQNTAIKSVLETFENKQRKALLVMATGTGKTRTAISLTDIMMKGNWVKNVLFLADRTALVKQAKNAYTALLPEVSNVNVVDEKDDISARIVFSTYPTMMNLIDETKDSGEKLFSVGHFDLIIIDEAHRSVYKKYRAIFEYFDALLIGLTATPKDEVDKNTYELFDIEDNVPTYAYELDEAVADGYLVPPKKVEVPTKLLNRGLVYSELSEEEREQYEMTFGDEETGELPLFIEPPNFNDWIFNKSTVDLVLKYLVEKGLKVEGGDKLGKTIIFAKNHKHAKFIEERFNKNYPYFGGKALRVIDNKVNYAQDLIGEFADSTKKYPFIAVSVDMLDTGIDIPEIVNLVFFKIVRSKSKFWQMIGRGTRLCPDLFAPGDDKKEFLVFDFCGNFAFFEVNTEGVEGSTQQSLSQILFEKRLSLLHSLQHAKYQKDEETKKLYDDLKTLLHGEVSRLDPNSFILRPHRRFIDEFCQIERWGNISNNDILDLKDHIAPFVNFLAEEDDLAKRFDGMILSAQVNYVEEKSNAAMQKKISAIAADLEGKANIPDVQKELELIREIQGTQFWKSATLSQLENVRCRVRNLVRLLDKKQKRHVYTNFQDDLGEATIHETEVIQKKENYLNKIQEILKKNQDHPTVMKIRNNIKLNETDIEGLIELLHINAPDIDKAKILEVFEQEPLGLFIRKILGLDREAAKKAFAQFLQNRTLSSSQQHFMNTVIDHLTSVGYIDAKDLYEQPYTDFHTFGLEGLFNTSEQDILFEIISDIKRNAQFEVNR